MDKLITVIVPIYNVEKYLKKCIESIINQTYKNLEIILVDDGSSDGSLKICNRYQKNDERIKVVHKENGGLSSARNTGLDIANGDLISFVDSDDYIEPTMLEELKANMDKYGSDISVCNFYKVKGNKKSANKLDQKEFVLKGKEKFIYLQNEYGILTVYAWNKLYKKEVFNSVRYPFGRIYEDSYVICDLLNNAKKVSYVVKPLYNYVYRKDSIVNLFKLEHFDKTGSFNKKIEFFHNKRYFDLENEEKNRKQFLIITNLSKMKANNIKNKEVFNKYYKEALELKKQIKWKDSSKKIKIFKIFGRFYIYFRAFEYKVLYLIRG